MSIYVNKNNQQLGPFDEKKVVEMLKSGQLSTDDLAVRQGEEQWQPLGNLFPADSISSAIPNPLTQESNPPKKGFGCLRLLGIALILLSVVTLIGGLANYWMRNFNNYPCVAADTAKQKLDEAFNKLSPQARNVSSVRDKVRLTAEDQALLEDFESKEKIFEIDNNGCIDLHAVKNFWVEVTVGITVVSLLFGIIGLVMVFVRRKS